MLLGLNAEAATMSCDGLGGSVVSSWLSDVALCPVVVDSCKAGRVAGELVCCSGEGHVCCCRSAKFFKDCQKIVFGFAFGHACGLSELLDAFGHVDFIAMLKRHAVSSWLMSLAARIRCGVRVVCCNGRQNLIAVLLVRRACFWR